MDNYTHLSELIDKEFFTDGSSSTDKFNVLVHFFENPSDYYEIFDDFINETNEEEFNNLIIEYFQNNSEKKEINIFSLSFSNLLHSYNKFFNKAKSIRINKYV